MDLPFVTPTITPAMMSYHLGSDMLHDHGPVVGKFAKHLISPQQTRPITRVEDEVVAFFEKTLQESGDPSVLKVLDAKETFEITSDTETLPSQFKWSVLDRKDDEFGFVHDAGPLLFRIFDKKNYVTYGTILDSATKPTNNRVFLPIPTEVPLNVFANLGFNSSVGPLGLKEETPGSGSLGAVLTYQGVPYDMVKRMRTTDKDPLVPKTIGKTGGFFASVTQVRTVLASGTDTRIPLYVIGKALGDALQVASIPLAQKDSGERLIHNTEDRLNYIRCLLFGVPVVYVHRPPSGSTIRKCEFYPSSDMITDTPAAMYERVLRLITKTIQGVVLSFKKVEAAAQTPAFKEDGPHRETYSVRFLNQVRLIKTGVLFHYAMFHAYYSTRTPEERVQLTSAIRESHRILADQSTRLAPQGSVFRRDNKTPVQIFYLCRANENDCDLGGFPFAEDGSGSTFDHDTTERVVAVLRGQRPIEDITQGLTKLTIDASNLLTYLTSIGVKTGVIGKLPPGKWILDTSGQGYGIRGSYSYSLLLDSVQKRDAPNAYHLIGGAQDTRKRTREMTTEVEYVQDRVVRPRTREQLPPGQEQLVFAPHSYEEYDAVLPGITRNTTSDLALFIDWSLKRKTQIDPLRAAKTIGALYRVADSTVYESIPDFGPIDHILDQFQLDTNASIQAYTPSEFSPIVEHWNEFVDDLVKSRITHDASKRTGFVSLHPTRTGGSRPPPPYGLSQKDWDDALDELEARYNK